ncbi:MAG: hypothetical protein QQN63_07885 [Nitrosopumilus sp.]
MTKSGQGFSIANFALDKTAEREGIWIDVGEGGLKLLIARISSPDFEAHLRRSNTQRGAVSRFRQQIIQRDDDAMLEEAIMIGVAKFILLNWENLTEEDGTPIAYSYDKALQLFKTYIEFYRMVLEYAAEYDGYRHQTVQATAKNLDNSSSGTPSGEKTPGTQEQSVKVSSSVESQSQKD